MFLWGNLRERDYLEDARCRWEDNIKMKLQQLRCGELDGIYLAQDRYSLQALLNAVLSIRVP